MKESYLFFSVVRVFRGNKYSFKTQKERCRMKTTMFQKTEVSSLRSPSAKNKEADCARDVASYSRQVSGELPLAGDQKCFEYFFRV